MSNQKYHGLYSIKIILPNELLNDESNKLVKTLTKTGNIKKIDNKKVIEIKTDNIDNPEIKYLDKVEKKVVEKKKANIKKANIKKELKNEPDIIMDIIEREMDKKEKRNKKNQNIKIEPKKQRKIKDIKDIEMKNFIDNFDFDKELVNIPVLKNKKVKKTKSSNNDLDKLILEKKKEIEALDKDIKEYEKINNITDIVPHGKYKIDKIDYNRLNKVEFEREMNKIKKEAFGTMEQKISKFKEKKESNLYTGMKKIVSLLIVKSLSYDNFDKKIISESDQKRLMELEADLENIQFNTDPEARSYLYESNKDFVYGLLGIKKANKKYNDFDNKPKKASLMIKDVPKKLTQKELDEKRIKDRYEANKRLDELQENMIISPEEIEINNLRDIRWKKEADKEAKKKIRRENDIKKMIKDDLFSKTDILKFAKKYDEIIKRYDKNDQKRLIDNYIFHFNKKYNPNFVERDARLLARDKARDKIFGENTTIR